MKLRLPDGNLISIKGIIDMVVGEGYIEITHRGGGIFVIGSDPDRYKFDSKLSQDEVDKIWNNLDRYSNENVVSWKTVESEILK